ncbi:MAG TPA: hypothetical protein DIT07_05345 [Sphingobacteriaceae bacterium]|nr:hypothetical protein [Sphingobacteriaceae bacterium]
MKIRTTLLLLFLGGLTSCKHDIDTQLLPGTWKPKNEIGKSTYGIITFFKNDSIIAKTFDYGRLTSEVTGKYKLETKTGILTTSYGDSLSYDLEIIKLNKTELELSYLRTKQNQLYLRQ